MRNFWGLLEGRVDSIYLLLRNQGWRLLSRAVRGSAPGHRRGLGAASLGGPRGAFPSGAPGRTVRISVSPYHNGVLVGRVHVEEHNGNRTRRPVEISVSTYNNALRPTTTHFDRREGIHRARCRRAGVQAPTAPRGSARQVSQMAPKVPPGPFFGPRESPTRAPKGRRSLQLAPIGPHYPLRKAPGGPPQAPRGFQACATRVFGRKTN